MKHQNLIMGLAIFGVMLFLFGICNLFIYFAEPPNMIGMLSVIGAMILVPCFVADRLKL